jgi:NADPH:quinone reductase-like Zn-dependent oxidoreductase
MAPPKQTAVHVKAFNKEDPSAAVEIVEVDVPSPKQGEVLVRITMRPINPADVISVQGDSFLHAWNRF